MGSDFLFARPSTLTGVARTLDLFGLFDAYNESLTPEQADEIAMWLDFLTIGQDISAATRQVEMELEPDQGAPSVEPVQYSFVFSKKKPDSLRE